MRSLRVAPALALLACTLTGALSSDTPSPVEKRCRVCPLDLPQCPTCPDGRVCSITPESCDTCPAVSCVPSASMPGMVSGFSTFSVSSLSRASVTGTASSVQPGGPIMQTSSGPSVHGTPSSGGMSGSAQSTATPTTTSGSSMAVTSSASVAQSSATSQSTSGAASASKANGAAATGVLGLGAQAVLGGVGLFLL